MAHFRRIVEDRAGPILLIGRLLLAWLFVHEGLILAGSLDAALSAMAKLGVAAPLALAAIAVQIAAGTARGDRLRSPVSPSRWACSASRPRSCSIRSSASGTSCSTSRRTSP